MREVHGVRRVARWVAAALAALIALVVLAVTLAYFALRTSWGRETLRSEIESRLDEVLVGGASIGGLSGDPFSELVLTDVVLNGPDREPAIRVERLVIELPLLPLISKQLRVRKLVADGLDVRIARLDDGTFNVARLTKPSEDESTWSIALPNVEVHRGHVRIDRGEGVEVIDLDDLEVYVDAKLPFGGPTEAALSVAGRWRQRDVPLALAASIRDDDEVLAVRSAVGHVGDVKLAVAGARMAKGPFATPLAGIVAIDAPAKAVRELAPGVELPQDVAIAVHARPDGRLTHFAVTGRVGEGDVRAFVTGDVQAKLARGVISATDLALDPLTRGSLAGRGGAVAAFDLDATASGELPAARAMVTAWAATPDAPAVDAVFAIDSGGDTLRATGTAASDNGVRAAVGAVVRKRGEALVLERGDLVARTLDLRRATQGKAPVRGVLNADLYAEGALAPEPDLTIRGHANGRNLRAMDLRASRLSFRIDAKHVPAKPAGTARLELRDLRRGDLELGQLTVAAGNRPDGKLQVTVRSRPKQAPWLVDLDALVTTGETTTVELQRHLVRASGGAVWRGTTGLLRITPRAIELRDLRSRSREGEIRAAGSYVRAGRRQGDLAARVDARLELSNLAEAYTGRVEASVDVRRANDLLSGTVDAKATGVHLGPELPLAFDATARIDAKADHLLADIGVATAKAGGAKLVLDVDAPKDIADVAAWRKLGRDAIRTARLSLERVDLAEIAKAAGARDLTGRVDGTVELSPAKASGSLAVRGVQTPQLKGLGAVDADLRVEQAGDAELLSSVTARLVPDPRAVAAQDITRGGDARLFAEARLTTPDRVFDPEAWRRLGAKAFRGGKLRVERLAFQPGTLERFGIVSALRGELAVGAELDEGLRAARFAINVHRLRGGLFARPVSINIAGAVDDTSSRVRANVRARGVTLVSVTSELPVTLEQLRADPDRVRTAKLSAEARIEHVPARTLMNVIGTSQITGGTLDGTIQVGGTVESPTIDAKLVARNVTVPDEGDRAVQQLERMQLVARWDGGKGIVEIDGNQTGGGMLRVRAAGSPDDLDAATATIQARKVDLAPLVAFMPGPAGGLGGLLEADLQMRGADPRTASLAGTLRITDGRIPIAPAVGTLFEGDVRVGVRDQQLGLRLTGKLGRGDVRLVVDAPLEGVTPKSGKLELTVRNVQLIGRTEPILTGSVDADLARVGDTWRSNLRVSGMTVKIPERRGVELSPVGAPSDLVFGGEKNHHGKHRGKDAPAGIVLDQRGPADFKPPSQVEGPPARRRAPDEPVVIANVQIRNVFVESEELRGLVGGRLRFTVGEDREVGIVGNIGLSRAVLDLFGRRYQVDRANLSFDGPPDPVLDIRITRDFPEVTTITEVRGRLSKPELTLSSEPGLYSQAELLGFLLGGEPGSDPEMAPSASERVAGAGASIIGNRIGSYVKRALPIDVDVLRYEAATSTDSAAILVGTWITDTLFLAYRQRLEARPDDNAGEGELEYWIRRRLVLQAVLGDRGVNGVDLLWRRRW